MGESVGIAVDDESVVKYVAVAVEYTGLCENKSRWTDNYAKRKKVELYACK